MSLITEGVSLNFSTIQVNTTGLTHPGGVSEEYVSFFNVRKSDSITSRQGHNVRIMNSEIQSTFKEIWNTEIIKLIFCVLLPYTN
jgi:hypothetical protein